MKKIYTLAAALMLGSFAMAQTGAPLQPANSSVHAGNKYMHQITVAQGNKVVDNERMGEYITEDFEMGFAGNNTGSAPVVGGSMWTTVVTPGSNVQVDWEITTVGHANDAGSTFTIPALNSTTGIGVGQWALLDSDSDGSGGASEENFLVSPEYDLTSVTNNALALEWQQFFAEWTNPVDDSIWVEISTDGGTNWTQMPSIDDGVGRDNRPNPEIVRIDLTALNLAGESSFMFRFHWKGEWNYGWQVDDVVLVDLPPDNLVLNTARATHNAVNAAGVSDKITYTKIPDEQVFDMEISGNVMNLGANAQTNVQLTGTSGAYTGMSPMIGLAPGEDSTLVASSFFNPGTTLQSHTVNYAVSYTNVINEDNPAGLLGSFTFEITDSEYSRDNDDYTGPGLWNGDDGAGTTNSFELGHAFQIEATDDMEGVSCALTGSSDAGVLAYASVYQVNTTSGEFDLVAQSNDVEIKSWNIPAATGAGSVETWFPLQATLNAGETYIVVIGHYGGPGALVLANSTTAVATANTTFLYDPNATTGGPWFYITSVPMVRTHFSVPAWAGVEDVEATSAKLFQNQPNPFNGTTTISYSLEQAGKVSLTVVDVNGKVVATFNEGMKSAGNYSVTFNADELASGIYNYSLNVNGERITKRMIITK